MAEAVPGLEIDDLVIQKYELELKQIIYGCKYTTTATATKYIVGVGCILYDPVMDVVMLANEYNKQQRILHINPGVLSKDLGYFEDFGGKVEYKHVNMHIFDIALGELFEETATLFNLHFDDMKTCFDKELYRLISVTDDLEYLCIIIPFNLTGFLRIREKFQENIKAITNNTFTCQKQFYEISNIQFFQLEKLKELDKTTPQEINGFYGNKDVVYVCEELCGQPLYISSRIKKVVAKLNGVEIAEDKKINEQNNIKGAVYNLNGIHHFVSKLYDTEARDQEQLKPVQCFLQKFFVSRLDSTASQVKLAIGGDIPLMYYNDIIDGTKSIPLDSPRLVIYTDNPCYVLFNNVTLEFFGEDQTNMYLQKWFKSASNSTQEYSSGTFFQLNDRIYFSYKEKEKETYERIFIGIVRLFDDSIIQYDDIIYRQTLAVEACSSVHIKCMNELVDVKKAKATEKPTEKPTETTIIQYFHDDEIALIRRNNLNSLTRFKKYQADKPTQINTANADVDAETIHLKGRYDLFPKVAELCCDGKITMNGTNLKFTEPESTDKYIGNLCTAINRNLQPIYKPEAAAAYTLCRASAPFEFDCTVNDKSPSIFELKNPDQKVEAAKQKFTYNGIMWVSETKDMTKLPDFYLGAGLYDCFIIEPPDDDKSTKFIVPYHRFNNTTDIKFDPYRVAYECIIPPGVTFEVKKVEYGLISVCTLKEDGKSNGTLVDDKKKTYWRRIITIQPKFATSPSGEKVAPPDAPPGTLGGKQKTRRKLKAEFY